MCLIAPVHFAFMSVHMDAIYACELFALKTDSQVLTSLTVHVACFLCLWWGLRIAWGGILTMH